MIESHLINDKQIWIKVDPHPVERSNPNIIPTEYFTVMYYMHDPEDENSIGVLMKDNAGSVKLFESPVAALGYARKKLEEVV